MSAAAPEPKTLWVGPGAAHVDFHRFAAAEYEHRVLEFLVDKLATAPCRWLQVAVLLLAVACASSPNPEVQFSRIRTESPSDRKIIRSGDLSLTVSAPDESRVEVERIVTEAGGLVESSRTAESYVSLQCRVPAETLDATMDAIAALGSVDSRSTSASDVTEQHADLSTRLANNVALRDRLKLLLDRATDVEDVLAIEKELTRIQSEIETQEASLERLDAQIALSELSVTLERRKLLGPLGYLAYGVWWGVSKLFVIR
jgi:hypothetical protein